MYTYEADDVIDNLMVGISLVATVVSDDPRAGKDKSLQPPTTRSQYTLMELRDEVYYTPQAVHLAVSAPMGVKVSLMADCLKSGSMVVASDHAVAMKRISRARQSSPRLVLRMKSSGGMAALISFKDLSR